LHQHRADGWWPWGIACFPNATPLETALVAAIVARIGAVPVPLKTLLSASTAPVAVLPWLAWEMAVYRWDSSWSEARKRDAIGNAIFDHRRRGTRGAMDALLAEYDQTLTLLEWWEPGGSGQPFTFWVTLPTNGADASSSTASFATSLIDDINRTKNARSLFQFRQQSNATVSLPINVAARTMMMTRSLAQIAQPDPADLLNLTTEYGEPLEGGEGLVWEYV
jgi:phage tail P2-like protein